MTTVKDLIEALLEYPLDATVTIPGATLDAGDLLIDSYDPVVKSWEPSASVIILPDSPVYHEQYENDLADWKHFQLYGRKKSIIIRFWDRDQHDLDCDCGLCSSVTHVSYGYAIFRVQDEDPYDVFYAPSEETALYNAKKFCLDNAFTFSVA